MLDERWKYRFKSGFLLKQLWSLLFLLIFFSACSSPEQRLHQLFDAHWEYQLEQNPLFATAQGDYRFNHLLPDPSIEAIYERDQQYRQFLSELSTIARDRLSRADQINYDIFWILLEQSIEETELGAYRLPLNGWWDYHAVFADLPNRVPFRNQQHVEDYLNRLDQFPVYNQAYIERMRIGMEDGFIRPKVVFGDYVDSVTGLLRDNPDESQFFEPFRNLPAQITEEDAADLKERARNIIQESVMKQLSYLADFLNEEYIPASAEREGIGFVPGGEEYYNYRIRYYTTLNLTAEEIHQTGLDEVQRIRTEMMEIVKEAGFDDDFDGFVHFLRTDPQFYAETPEQLMKKTTFVLKMMDGRLPELFKTLPRLPYGIMEIPEHLAPRTTTAYYSRGRADGTRAGFYAVNTYNLPSRPLYEVEALSLHEAVPGHHLQIALQQELENLPNFRTSASFTAYVEGWALYAERLGLEVGFYEDMYSNFGRLSYEMWRALRLVVDTGLHAKGWSRQQAVDFMAENSALSLHNINAEVNRYIFWPGQALAYKIGEIKIRELRALAEQELGDSFDIRSFHDAILLSGSVPLEVLEENILIWISERSGE